MGSGVGFKCSKCGKEYCANTGIGFLFPEVYKETLADVKAGKYGEEWKRLALSEELVAVDAERYLYVCKKCGHWEVEYGLSLYAPNNVKKLKKKKYGEKTVEQWGEVPYVMSMDLEEDYHLLKRRVHKCEKCGGVMHKATRDEESNLPCPDCGGAPEKGYLNIINWD